MDTTVSGPVKIAALALVVVGVAGAGTLQLLGRSSAPEPAAPVAPVHPHPAASRPVAPAKPAHGTPVHAKRVHAKPVVKAPVAKAPVAKKPAPKPHRPSPVTAAGLPVALADALKAHRIVVVSVVDPQSETDAISYAEARAGAADAAAGFLGVSVLDDAVAGPLTAILPGGGLLPDPGLLVYRRPGVLVARVDGFLDRTGVAQTAVSAVTAAPVAAPAATTPTTTTPTVP